MPDRVRVGVVLRRLREQRGLTQAALARALGISPSYVNQLESNQRPLTEAVRFKLADVLQVDLEQFSPSGTERLVAELSDVVADPAFRDDIARADLRELAASMPAVGRLLVELHRRYRHGLAVNDAIATRIDASVPMAYEEVRELFYAHRNYIATLDTAAERVFAEARLTIGATVDGLTQRLARHGTTVVDLPAAESMRLKRRFDPDRDVLALSAQLNPGQRAFQLATHLAMVEFADQIEDVVRAADLSTDETRALARVGLANYAAGALVLPYRPFRDAAEQLRYDIDLLRQRFQVGYETVAHRLSTLQRPGTRGVPFFFVRVDRAGNVSKRQSATDFHFSRVGGSCPLWNVYDAFAHPFQIRTQLAEMPDGRRYLWVARTVTRRTGGYRTPAKTFAIGLGCDLRHASRLVYADDLDLDNPAALTPIGPGCKVCDRTGCPQRALPAVGRPLDVDPHHARFVPYATVTRPH
ncbi:short-chain fatty acyl-CoA regulator family protein [Rugosimonospora acidiphila]|uniref:Short-chain fatty acyl-CoA regulator family protein n=1 Tax=Rugosimonospora acidiphila TaxID=556531 RepID=A0ABP9SMF3_9ACTN